MLRAPLPFSQEFVIENNICDKLKVVLSGRGGEHDGSTASWALFFFSKRTDSFDEKRKMGKGDSGLTFLTVGAEGPDEVAIGSILGIVTTLPMLKKYIQKYSRFDRTVSRR